MAQYWRCASSHVADDTEDHRRSRAQAQSDLTALWAQPNSDPVGQAKSVAFSDEGEVKAEPLLQALFGASV